MEGDGQGMVAIIKGRNDGLTVTVLPNQVPMEDKRKQARDGADYTSLRGSCDRYDAAVDGRHCATPTISASLPVRGAHAALNLEFGQSPFSHKKCKSYEMTRETSFFAQTLRQYPAVRPETASGELLQEVLTNAQWTHVKRKTQSAKRPPHKTASQHACRQKKYWFDPPKDPKKNNARPSTALPNRTNHTYDYFGSQSATRTMEVRYMTAMKKICDEFRNVISSKPVSCPKLQCRYKQHKKHCKNAGTDFRITPCKCKGIQVSLPNVLASAVCHDPTEIVEATLDRFCQCRLSSYVRSEVSDGKNNKMAKEDKESNVPNTDRLKLNIYERQIKEWTEMVTDIHSLRDLLILKQLISQLANKLQYLVNKDDFIAKAKIEIVKYLQEILKLQPNINQFNLKQLANDLFKTLFRFDNVYKKGVDKLIQDLPLREKDINKAKETVNDFLQHINIERFSDYDNLKVRIVDLLQKLPLNCDSEWETLNSLANTLLNNLFTLMKVKEDKNTQTSNEDVGVEKYVIVTANTEPNPYLPHIIDWFKSIPDLDTHLDDNIELIEMLSNRLNEIGQNQNLKNILPKIKEDMLSWLKNILNKTNLPMDRGTQENIINKLISVLIRLPLQNDLGNHKSPNRFFNDVSTWFNNIPYINLGPEVNVQAVLSDLCHKLNNIEEHDHNTSQYNQKIQEWLKNLDQNYAININAEDVNNLKTKIFSQFDAIKQINQNKDENSEMKQSLQKEIIDFVEKFNINLNQKDLNIIQHKIIPYALSMFSKHKNSLLEDSFREKINNLFSLMEINIPTSDRNILVEKLLNHINRQRTVLDSKDELNSVETVSENIQTKTVSENKLPKDNAQSNFQNAVQNTNLIDSPIAENVKYINKNDKYFNKKYFEPQAYRREIVDTLGASEFSKNLLQSSKCKNKKDGQNINESVYTNEIFSSTPRQSNEDPFPAINSISPIFNERKNKGTSDILLNHVIKDWIDVIEIKFTKKEKEKCISYIASDLFDRQKYLELTKKSISDFEEMDYLKFLIFKVFNPILEDDKLDYVLNKINKLYKMLNQVYEPAENKKLRSGINNEPRDIKSDLISGIDMFTLDPISAGDIQELTRNIQKYKRDSNNKNIETIIEKEILKWLKTKTFDLNDHKLKELKCILTQIFQNDIGKDFENIKSNKVNNGSSNINIKLNKPYRNLETVLEQLVNVILHNVSLNNTSVIKNHVQNCILHLLNAISTQANEKLYKIIDDQISDFISLINNAIELNQNNKSDSNKMAEVTKIPKRVLYDTIKTFCDGLPIYTVNIIGSKDKKYEMKKVLAKKILDKLIELHKNHLLFENNNFNESIISNSIDLIIHEIPISQWIRKDIKNSKEILLSNLKLNKQKIQAELDSIIYEQELKNTLFTNTTDIDNWTSEDKIPIKILIESLADAFINLYSIKAEGNIMNVYKHKLNDEIQKFCDAYLQRYPASPLTRTQICSKLYEAIDNITKPQRNSSFTESTLKSEIECWLDEVLIDFSSITPENKDKMISLLTKRLFELNKGNESFNIDHAKIKEAIFSCLQTILLKQSKISLMVQIDNLIERVKKIGHFKNSSPTKNVSMFTIPIASSNSNMNSEIVYKNNLENKSFEKSSKNTFSLELADSVTIDDNTLRTKANRPKTFNKYATPKISHSSSLARSEDMVKEIHRDDLAERDNLTEIVKTYPKTLNRFVNGKSIDIHELQKGVSPKVIVREYLWNSDESQQSSQIVLPPKLTNKTTSTQAIERRSDEISMSFIRNNVSDRNMQISDHAKTLHQINMTPQKTHVHEEKHGIEQEKNYTNSEPQDYGYNKTRKDFNQIKNQGERDNLTEIVKTYPKSLHRFVNSKSIDIQESQKGVSPKVVVREYLLNSDESQRSSQIVLPPTLTNKTTSTQAIERRSDEISMSFIRNNVSDRNMQISDHAKTLDQINMTLQKTHVDEDQHGIEQEKNYTNSEPQEYGYNKTRKDFNQIKNQGERDNLTEIVKTYPKTCNRFVNGKSIDIQESQKGVSPKVVVREYLLNSDESQRSSQIVLPPTLTNKTTSTQAIERRSDEISMSFIRNNVSDRNMQISDHAKTLDQINMTLQKTHVDEDQHGIEQEKNYTNSEPQEYGYNKTRKDFNQIKNQGERDNLTEIVKTYPKTCNRFVNGKSIDIQESQKGVSPKVVVREYLLNSDESQQSSQIVLPPILTNKTTSTQAIERRSDEISMSSIRNHVSYRNMQISDHAKTLDQINMTPQKTHVHEDKHGAEQEKNYTNSEPQDYCYNKRRKDFNQIKNQGVSLNQNQRGLKPEILTDLPLPDFLLAKRQYKLPSKFILIPDDSEKVYGNIVCCGKDRTQMKCRMQPCCRRPHIPRLKLCQRCPHSSCPYPSCLYFKTNF